MKKPPELTPEKEAQFARLSKMLNKIKPEYVPADDAFKTWWKETGQPTVLDQYLSELRRYDQAEPRILGFMENGSMGVVKLNDIFDGKWGDAPSKDATAAVHAVSARAPGTLCACFVSETWMVRPKSAEEMEKWRGKSYATHPDREEAITISSLKYNWDTNHMMQLMTIAEVIKVFANPRTPRTWRETKYGEIKVIDPRGGGDRFEGRFVPSDKGDDNDG